MSEMQFDPSQLADIHLPENIGMWPIAPGWWILLGLFVVLCLLIFLLSKETHRAQKSISPKQLKSLALKELSAIENHYQSSTDAHESVKKLSIFLRRFALSHYHREQVASLSDTQWLELLDQMNDPSHQQYLFSEEFADLLSKVPYQPTNSIIDTQQLEKLFNTAKHLVRSYKKTNPSQVSNNV